MIDDAVNIPCELIICLVASIIHLCDINLTTGFIKKNKKTPTLEPECMWLPKMKHSYH